MFVCVCFFFVFGNADLYIRNIYHSINEQSITPAVQLVMYQKESFLPSLSSDPVSKADKQLIFCMGK